jgi:hypothetical protein
MKGNAPFRPSGASTGGFSKPTPRVYTRPCETGEYRLLNFDTPRAFPYPNPYFCPTGGGERIYRKHLPISDSRRGI